MIRLPLPARILAVSAVVLLLGSCGGSGERRAPRPESTEVGEPTPPALTFTEVAGEVGLEFTHNSGAFGSKWLPETMGSGCAWPDVDGDGDPDALLLSGMDFQGHPTGGRRGPALFRNDGGRFTDITAPSGLDDPTYAMGVTFGDYDGDGDADLYITAVGPNRLYRNDGGVFTDVAPGLGLDDDGFGTSATWFDLEGDGDLDLFSLNYVAWSPKTDIFCSLDGTTKSYCTPEPYRGASPRLWRNDGGAFTDVTAAAGLADDSGKALGVVAFDYDGDGRQDLFVANDTQPNFLWRNRGDGTFVEEGLAAGVAFDEQGRARGAMGVDVADWDGAGRPGLAIGNFSNEMLALYRNEGTGLFLDEAPRSEVGRTTLLTLAFGVQFLDADLDGRKDLFVANGHVETEIQRVQEEVSYAQTPHLFWNAAGGGFVDLAEAAGDLSRPLAARGAATADFDGDGDLDLLVNTVDGPARLYRNDGPTGNALRLRLEGGAGSNPDGYGARVEVRVEGRVQRDWARAGRSYLSQPEGVLTFGLGAAEAAEDVRVYWPSGRVSRLGKVTGGPGVHVVREERATEGP